VKCEEQENIKHKQQNRQQYKQQNRQQYKQQYKRQCSSSMEQQLAHLHQFLVYPHAQQTSLSAIKTMRYNGAIKTKI
jgi:hypothetical protein